MKSNYLFVAIFLYISNIGAQQSFYELNQLQTIDSIENSSITTVQTVLGQQTHSCFYFGRRGSGS